MIHTIATGVSGSVSSLPVTLAPSFPLSGTMQHPTLGQVRYQLTEVSDDPDQQVADTIALMREYANADGRAYPLYADMTRAQQINPAAEPLGNTFEYLRRNGTRGMRFVRDEVTGAPFEAMQAPGGWRPVVETLMRPFDQAVSSAPQGDCDDFSMYGAAHLVALGIPCSFATVAADGAMPDQFTHVYLVAYPKAGPYAGMRVPLDLSHGPQLGWEVPNRYGKFQEWPINRGLGLLGIGAVAGGAYLLYRALKRRAS